MIFCLLNSKDKKTYIKLLSTFKKTINFTIPGIFITDFESPLTLAIKYAFHVVSAVHCLFQTKIMKNVNKCELLKLYNTIGISYKLF